LFNYLYAKNQNGQFLLRIEDTDRERSSPEFEKEILASLKWLGLHWDGELVHQSKRLDRYQSLAKDLLDKKLAVEEKKEGKTAVKFKMPHQKVIFEDLVHGKVEFDTSLFDDLVLLKSDGYPTYHWACVVDDHDMEMTHVIRGDDHLSNTPRQLMLYEALGWKPPKFAHLPLILGDDGSPLSKRHGNVSLPRYREEGYLPEGLMNYLALLGWGAGGNQEFFSLEELINKFSLKRINKANARFDPEKLKWLNGQHIKKLPKADYISKMTDFFDKKAKAFENNQWEQLVLLYQGRIETMRDLLDQADYCFADIDTYDLKTSVSFFKNTSLRNHLGAWNDQVSGLSDFRDPQKIEELTRQSAKASGVEARDLIHPLRFALTGKTVSPGLFEMMSVLGKETCIRRVRNFLSSEVRRP